MNSTYLLGESWCRNLSKNINWYATWNEKHHWSKHCNLNGQYKSYWPINSLKFYKENKIKVIDWPLNKSDLNSVEILWGFKKQIGYQK